MYTDYIDVLVSTTDTNWKVSLYIKSAVVISSRRKQYPARNCHTLDVYQWRGVLDTRDVSWLLLDESHTFGAILAEL